MLVSRRGESAARLLPGVHDVLVFDAPWVLPDPEPVRAGHLLRLLVRLRRKRLHTALVLTSFHQSPLPLALLLRLAGVPRVVAASEDYPGSLLDQRVPLGDDLHEAQRAAAIAEAAGFPASGTHLSVRPDLPDATKLVGRGRYVVVHPGADAPARSWPAVNARAAVSALARAGHRVVVTGGPDERALTARVAGSHALDLGGRTDLPQLAAVLAGAEVVVVGNTGPAHLAAAVATPVVSLFAPVVPVARWAPHGIPVVLLGDQHQACTGSRWRVCQIPGHPCLSSVTPDDVLAAVNRLAQVSA
jgi:ADP-heptose:LPS heptosyltransferase